MKTAGKVLNPIDFTKIKNKVYNNLLEFRNDIASLAHNCAIMHSRESSIFEASDSIYLFTCSEIDCMIECTECYKHSLEDQEHGFMEACQKQHKVIRAKSENYEFWLNTDTDAHPNATRNNAGENEAGKKSADSESNSIEEENDNFQPENTLHNDKGQANQGKTSNINLKPSLLDQHIADIENGEPSNKRRCENNLFEDRMNDDKIGNWCDSFEKYVAGALASVKTCNGEKRNLVSQLQKDLENANSKICVLEEKLAQEKAILETKLKDMTEKYNEFEKNTKSCTSCGKKLETVLFCNAECISKLMK